jgi:hypothetical protein
MRVRCNIHGCQETLVCSNVPWYNKMWSVANVSFNDCSIVDMEDLKKKRKTRTQVLPFIVELNVFMNDQFLKTEDIDAQLKHIRLTYPKNIDYIIKISGKLVNDMEVMSQIVLDVHAKTNARILVQVSVERLIILSKLPNSCFYKSRIYPSIKYFLVKGEEKLCLDDIIQVIGALKAFDGIKLAVSVSVEKPMADLSSLLAFLRVQYKTVKFIEIVIERSPKNILKAMNTIPSTQNIPKQMMATNMERKNIYTDIVDPYDVLQTIQEVTDGTISINDFYPVSMAQIFEPFLPNLNIERYQFRPSPFCGYGTVLVNNDEYFSVPFTRLINFEKLYKELTPILPKIVNSDIGLSTISKLKTIIDNCAMPGVKLPNIISYLIDSSKLKQVLELIDSMQFFILHNHMDVTNLDMARRCNCAVLGKNVKGPGFVATCSNCI